jgi:hypothetical protein
MQRLKDREKDEVESNKNMLLNKYLITVWWQPKPGEDEY